MERPLARPLSRARAHALLHLTVLLWGMTAILGKSIELAAVPLVFYRVAIVTVLMAGLLVQRGIELRVPRRRALELAAAGVLVALHWTLFYGAIKRAGVSVAVLCLSTITFFTAVFEPIFFRRPFRRHELVLGALVVVGVVLLLRLEVRASAVGYATGLGASFFSALFGIWNGSIAQRERAERVTLYELGAAGVACGLASLALGDFVAPWSVAARDWALLSVLAVVCTMLPWLWSLRVLRTLSPYTVAISVTLEPVYSLVLAYWLWPTEERLGLRFYAGASLLLGLVVVNGVLKATRSTA